jgi:hypothetical protein
MCACNGRHTPHLEQAGLQVVAPERVLLGNLVAQRPGRRCAAPCKTVWSVNNTSAAAAGVPESLLKCGLQPAIGTAVGELEGFAAGPGSGALRWRRRCRCRRLLHSLLLPLIIARARDGQQCTLGTRSALRDHAAAYYRPSAEQVACHSALNYGLCTSSSGRARLYATTASGTEGPSPPRRGSSHSTLRSFSGCDAPAAQLHAASC